MTPLKRVFVDSSIAPPPPGPALAGNPVVPTGYFLQPTRDGQITRSDPDPALDNFWQHVIPFYSGGYPPIPGTGPQLLGPGL